MPARRSDRGCCLVTKGEHAPRSTRLRWPVKSPRTSCRARTTSPETPNPKSFSGDGASPSPAVPAGPASVRAPPPISSRSTGCVRSAPSTTPSIVASARFGLASFSGASAGRVPPATDANGRPASPPTRERRLIQRSATWPERWRENADAVSARSCEAGCRRAVTTGGSPTPGIVAGLDGSQRHTRPRRLAHSVYADAHFPGGSSRGAGWTSANITTRGTTTLRFRHDQRPC